MVPKKEAKKTKKKEKKVAAVRVDVVREINKGLDKDLTPAQILMHLEKWEPEDGKADAINALCFPMFERYFSEDYEDVTPREFFKDYGKLLKFIVPTDHVKNQLKLLFIAQAMWYTSQKEGSKRATSGNALRVVFRNLVGYKIVTVPVVGTWRDDTKDISAGKKEALKDVEALFKALGLDKK